MTASAASQWSPDLAWVLDALWGHSGDVQVSPLGEVPAHRRTVDSFALFPTPTRPRLMVPLGSGRAASQALHDHATHKKVVRMAKPVLARALRSGLARRLVRHGVTVSVAGDTQSEALPGLLLKEHLREVIGRRDIETAVKFNAKPPHRKPTLQVLGGDGQVLAYVKVGWNELTRELVRTEARALAQLTGPQTQVGRFEVPRVIHAGSWRGLELLALEPLARGPWYRRRPPLRTSPSTATAEIASLGETTRAPLGESEFWKATSERIARTEQILDQPSPLAPAAERLERLFGETPLSFGWWHGDWVPWNMGHVRDRLYVWDWERSGPLAPIGLDDIHFEYQAALGISKLSPPAAADHVLERPQSSLSALGLPEALRPLLLCLHLLEMSLRFEEGRAAGVDIVDLKYRPVLEKLFE
jgi:hypothetical protein